MSNELRFLVRGGDVLNKVPSNSSLLRQGNVDALDLQGAELALVHLLDAKPSGEPDLQDSSLGIYFKVGTSLDVNSSDKLVRVGPCYVTSDGTRPDQNDLNNQDVDYTGNFWYREDTNTFYLNTTGEQNAEAWWQLTPTFSSELPVPYDVGGIRAGTTFDKLRLETLVERLLYPESAVNIQKLVITPDPIGVSADNLKLEVGQPIPSPGGANQRTLSIITSGFNTISTLYFTGGIDPDALLTAQNAFPNGFYSGVGAARTYTYNQSPVITYPYPTTYYWGVTAVNNSNELFEGPRRSVSWVYRSWMLTSTNTDVIDPAAVPAAQSLLGRAESYTKPVLPYPAYAYVFLPLGREVGVDFIADGYAPYTEFDLVNGFGVAITRLDDVTVFRNGVAVRYARYRTAHATSASIKLRFN